MGRLLDAAATTPNRHRGPLCSFCEWIKSLDDEDRADLEHLAALPVQQMGHARLQRIISEQLSVDWPQNHIGECRRKGHHGPRR